MYDSIGDGTLAASGVDSTGDGVWVVFSHGMKGVTEDNGTICPYVNGTSGGVAPGRLRQRRAKGTQPYNVPNEFLHRQVNAERMEETL